MVSVSEMSKATAPYASVSLKHFKSILPNPDPFKKRNHNTSKGNLELFGSRERAHYEVEESRMSFPSGHAAHSFQAVTFMILYLQVCFPDS